MKDLIANRKVHKYLKSRKSWSFYKEALIKSGKDKSKILHHLLGGKRSSSYISAFPWDDTEQGFKYWEKENRLLEKWYRANIKEIEKCNIYIDA